MITHLEDVRGRTSNVVGRYGGHKDKIMRCPDDVEQQTNCAFYDMRIGDFKTCYKC